LPDKPLSVNFRPLRFAPGVPAVTASQLPLALAQLGLIDEYEFVVQPELGARRANSPTASVVTVSFEGRAAAPLELPSRSHSDSSGLAEG
jgi:hypothetical protein